MLSYAIVEVMRKIVLSYQKNIRDLGGYVGYGGKKVKESRLYRGGFLGRVSSEDIKIINSLKLTDIVDFRSKTEYTDRPDYAFMGVTFHNLPTMDETNDEQLKKNNEYDDSNLLWFLNGSTDGKGHMKRTYVDVLFSKSGRESLKEFFSLLIKDEYRVVYFHCSQGKDRAGLAAYLLLTALGVSEEDKIKDYLLSNEAMAIKIPTLKAMLKNKPYYNKEYERALTEVFSADLEYLNAALDAVKENCGSVMNYLTDILEVNIERLKEIYLQ